MLGNLYDLIFLHKGLVTFCLNLLLGKLLDGVKPEGESVATLL